MDSKMLKPFNSFGESNRKLAEQTDKANALAQEKTVLQQNWTALPLPPGMPPPRGREKGAGANNRQLAQQKELASQAAGERDKLQARLTALTADAEAATALRARIKFSKSNWLISLLGLHLRDAKPAACRAQAKLLLCNRTKTFAA